MRKLTLKAIKFGCDFRFNESSNYEQLVQSKHFPGPPKKSEVYLLVSKTGNQLVWILNVGTAERPDGTTKDVVDTRRWRLTSGIWSHHMLQNYANAVGFELVGFKRLEEEFLDVRQ